MSINTPQTKTKDVPSAAPEAPSDKMDAPKGQEKQASKYTQDELLKLFDELIFDGVYSETTKIKGKLAVTFRTKSTQETIDITKELDGNTYKMVTTMQQDRAFLNLVYALTHYQGKDISTQSKEEKAKFLGKLPIAILGAISDELARFDAKVAEACEEAEANF